MTTQDYEIIHQFVLDYAIPTEFVQITQIDGMKITIRTKEQGHNLPHIHLETNAASLSIGIENQQILAKTGNINPSQLKKALAWVKDNQELLKRNWNELSNGIKIEI